MKACRSPSIVFVSVLLLLHVYSSQCSRPGIRSDDADPDAALHSSRDTKQLNLFHWLFGNVGSATVAVHPNSTHNSSSSSVVKSNRTALGPEPIIIGPIQIDDIQNSTLKRVSLTPAFEKGLRDEIYKYNLEQNFRRRSGEPSESQSELSGKSVKKRFARRAGSLQRKHEVNGFEGSSKQILKRQGLIYPQQQLYLQQQAAAALQQQQQLYLLQNQGLGGGGGGGRYNRRRRPYLYGDYDDDSDSDEYDDFDSDEFMSYPIRAGFIPGIGGFRGRK